MAEQKQHSYVGLGLAIAIFMLWCGSGVLLLGLPLSQISWWAIIFAIGCRTFLHTGLFILAHDAMHGNLIAHRPSLNRAIGQIAVGLYACLSYNHCQANHLTHHHQPEQVGDPDFHDGTHCHPIFWYCKFMQGYFSVSRFLLFLSILSVFSLGTKLIWDVHYLNLCLFFLVPLILSSLQLFIFGTYLPHGQKGSFFDSRYFPSTLRYIWSLLSCYHFGAYHQRHHACPQLSWFQLPQADQSSELSQEIFQKNKFA